LRQRLSESFAIPAEARSLEILLINNYEIAAKSLKGF